MSIFELHGEGKGIKEISRELGFSRNTVRKYLRTREVPKRKPAVKSFLFCKKPSDDWYVTSA